MVIARIGKTYEFEAAHRLDNHFGKCSNLHGHNYTATIELYGPTCEVEGQSDEGMVLDYFVLDQIWREHLEGFLDHKFLNESLPSLRGPTTAENIAGWIFENIAYHLTAYSPTAMVSAVTVCETPKTFATVEGAPSLSRLAPPSPTRE